MKRYSKGIKTNDHKLSDVFQAYESTRETQFVESFFGDGISEANPICASFPIILLFNDKTVFFFRSTIIEIVFI